MTVQVVKEFPVGPCKSFFNPVSQEQAEYFGIIFPEGCRHPSLVPALYAFTNSLEEVSVPLQLWNQPLRSPDGFAGAGALGRGLIRIMPVKHLSSLETVPFDVLLIGEHSVSKQRRAYLNTQGSGREGRGEAWRADPAERAGIILYLQKKLQKSVQRHPPMYLHPSSSNINIFHYMRHWSKLRNEH